MVFRIRIAFKVYHSLSATCENCLEVEGCDLAALTTHLRSFLKSRSSEEHFVQITAVNHQDEPTIDWNSRDEAHQFCQALAALEDELHIFNFVCFPLALLKMLFTKEVERVVLYDSVLDSMASPCDDIILPDSFLETHEMACSGYLTLRVSNVLRASDWTAYASYLQNVFVDHPEQSCLKSIVLQLEVSDVVVDLQQEEYQLFMKAISSIRTRHLYIFAREFPASFLSNLVFAPNLECLYLELCDLDLTLDGSDYYMAITIKCSDPDWLVLAAWLPQIRLLDRVSFQECILRLEPSMEEEVNLEHYLTFLENLCALQMERVAIGTYSSSLVLVPILLKTFLSSGKELQKLDVWTDDCDWMNHNKIVEALKGKTRILEMAIEVRSYWIRCQPETVKKLEDVLRANHTITSLRLPYALTPTLKMYLKLNKDGRRQLFASKGDHDLTPDEWIGSLLSTIEDYRSANELKLSCLFYFVRNYSSYYVSLFWRASMDDR